jgi:hypothetical protein
MHCPNCGTEASTDQKFCRACGFGLEKVAQLIAEEAATAPERTNEANAGPSDDRLRKLEKWALRALFALGGILGGLMLWGVIVKVMIEEGSVFKGSIILMIIAAMGLFAFLGYLESQRKKSVSTRSTQPPPPAPAQETARMLSEPDLDMAASVTEHTTARLEEKVEASIEKPQSS